MGAAWQFSHSWASCPALFLYLGFKSEMPAVDGVFLMRPSGDMGFPLLSLICSSVLFKRDFAAEFLPRSLTLSSSLSPYIRLLETAPWRFI